MLGNLQVEPDSSTFTGQDSGTQPDGEVAKLIALTLADEFVEEERTAYYAQQDKSDRIEVKIRSRAIGYDQIQPKPALNAIAGAMLGLLFGIGVVLVLSWMEADRLYSPVAVERSLNLPVLGTIPAAGSQRESAQAAPRTGQVPAPKTA
ncbi:MAG: hypothetical protein R2838_12100 [Caldilineaceae bacterium]